MDMSLFALWGAVGILAIVLHARQPDKKREVLRLTLRNAAMLLPMLICAVVAAGFLSEMLPRETIAVWIGPGSGAKGIFIGSAVGALIPGGPMISFPLVVTFERAGAGVPQIIAMVSGWSVIAIHRLIAWEIPLMGARFVLSRILVSIVLPPLSGFAAELLIAITR